MRNLVDSKPAFLAVALLFTAALTWNAAHGAEALLGTHLMPTPTWDGVRIAHGPPVCDGCVLTVSEKHGPPVCDGCVVSAEKHGPPVCDGCVASAAKHGPPVCDGCVVSAEKHGPPVCDGCVVLKSRVS
jgi:hypothetical protein